LKPSWGKALFLQKIDVMGVFLFDEMIFGPVRSRRLGVSLGLNLLPTHRKVCSFNCIYCECGWTEGLLLESNQLPAPATFSDQLSKKLQELQGTDLQPDSLTFAGNGEPTIHPHFAEIIKETLRLRDLFAPDASVSVLSNGSMLHKPEIVEALMLADQCLLKLDGGTEATIRDINHPSKAFKLETYIGQLEQFNGKLIIQSLFLRGEHNRRNVDNTTEAEVAAWIELLKRIKPQKVMLYAIERATPEEKLVKISRSELEQIAMRVQENGIAAEVFA